MSKVGSASNWKLIQAVAVFQVDQSIAEGNVFPSSKGKLVPENPLSVTAQK
jgi:hypothetical protein